MIATSVKAAPQARSTTAWRGEVMSLKICVGSEFICCPRLKLSTNVAPAVNSSGAVSPIPRATARSEPVTRPGSAVGRTTRVTTRQRGAPSASAASRKLSGTSCRTTSAERLTTGSISSDSATAPFQAANDSRRRG